MRARLTRSVLPNGDESGNPARIRYSPREVPSFSKVRGRARAHTRGGCAVVVQAHVVVVPC